MRRGFTLIELMVALSAGLFLSIFVFMLTRDVSRFFQAEARVSDATMGAVIGFERLKADIARAGFLSSPNLRRDPSRCPRPPGPLNWTNVPTLVEMGLLYIYRGEGGAALTTGASFLTLNGLTPDRLRLFGNYQSTDQFPARSVIPSGSTTKVHLEPTSGPLLRLGYAPGSPTAAEIIKAAFPAGRALRLVNAEGEEQYGIIAQVAEEGLAPVISLAQNVLPVQFKSSGGICGIRGHGSDTVVNVVNIIDYRLDDALRNTAAYRDLRPTLGEGTDADAETDDSTRTDLIREEIDPTSPVDSPVAFDRSQQIVAEYAVDFRLGLTAVTEATTLALTRYGEGDALMDGFARPNVAATPNQGPHYIRAVRPRLSVRARVADRAGNVNTSSGSAVAPGLYRVALRTPNGPFARVRSLSATIATRNAREALWQ